MTNGASGVTDGEARGVFLRVAALISVVTAAVAVVNALSVIADRPDIAQWEPWSWEITSAAAILALMWIPWLAVRRAPPGGAPWPRLLIVHGPALLVYSALHVAGFIVLREGAYAAMGSDYGFGARGPRFLYELRKDALTYLSQAAIFWIGLQLGARTSQTRAARFDIRDGARIIRVGADDIVAVTAAGNYAEFILINGRRPLMRATLARLETDLSPLGLIRTHRSWLVNPAHLTALEPDGSGDWTVELGAVSAPVSRRYPAALERLRR